MSEPVKLSGYKKIVHVCGKCGIKAVVETDYLSETQAKNLHTCKKKGK